MLGGTIVAIEVIIATPLFLSIRDRSTDTGSASGNVYRISSLSRGDSDLGSRVRSKVNTRGVSAEGTVFITISSIITNRVLGNL